MDLIQVLETRRSIRRYEDRGVDRTLIEKLITLATQAPSAMNAQPWAFAVITDKQKLEEYSTQSKALLLDTMDQHPLFQRYRAALSRKAFNIFYNAPVLIVIYAKPEGPVPEADACLAAHNEGLGTCWIGFSRDFLNSSELKAELGIPDEYTAAAPLVLGYAAIDHPAVPRKDPEIYYF